MNKGTYIILLKLKNELSFEIRKKKYILNPGIYAYVGSAMKNLHQRVGRHIDYKSGKYKKHWHIDNLLDKGDVLFSFIIPDGIYREEEISKKLSEKFQYIDGFGASDLKVKSNLFVIDDNEKFFLEIKKIIID
jgi:Uri superfamily endonuclease